MNLYDTPRLDFVLHSHPTFDRDRDRHWITFHVPEVGRCVAYGKDWREAIDNAINGLYKPCD